MTSTLPPIVQAFSGSIGGTAASASAYPLDLVCTRLQTSDSNERPGISSAISTLRQIIKKRGISGLYDGLETDTAATLISGFFYFYAYSFLRDQVFKRNPKSVSAKSKRASPSPALAALEEIAIGFLAGVATRTISTPLSLITVRLQNEARQDSESRSDDEKEGCNKEGEEEEALPMGSITTVIKSIHAEGGLRGFWRGFETTTLLCLNPSLTLFLYQAFRKVFPRGKDRERPSPRQAFVGAAISNVIAVTILYPLIFAKTRLQSQRRSKSTGSGLSSDAQSDADTKSSSMFAIWSSAYAQSGISGLYRGLEAQLVKGFVSQGLAMMVKQRIEQLIVAAYLKYVHAKKSKKTPTR